MLIHWILVLIFLNGRLLLIEIFIDAEPGLQIVVLVLLPISEAIGMYSRLAAVHFGVLVVSNMIIGLVTLSVGSTPFVASAVSGATVAQMVPYVLRFLLVIMLTQLIITYYPPITTFLPSLMGK
ncbi:TRAP transporter large permease subunit [Tunicatimonas pelagia]|uniref:TRAP transporter large permease subunit n=1 Tax=Tunicatimonas pelagia TaxID=931531 RepID=UPI002665732D|nr:TRAP transporter large permease subunit [Tunicatimonas pelagia]WKN44199.1 TRAP transporter large permease subunit [Tunicatimonas pelagia]